jgi:hypothetical protein
VTLLERRGRRAYALVEAGRTLRPVGGPELGHYRLLFGIAGITNGLIFDGQWMLDAHGQLVLDKFGQSGLQVFSEKEIGWPA